MHAGGLFLDFSQERLTGADQLAGQVVGLVHTRPAFLVGAVQAFQLLDVGFQAGGFHQARVVRQHGGSLLQVGDFGHVLDLAEVGVATQGLVNEELLARQDGPALLVVGTLHGMGVNLNILVLVALAEDASLALLKKRGNKRCVQMVHGDEALLGIDTGAHVLAGSDQDAHAPGIHVLEQLELVIRLFVVGHERHMIRRNAGVPHALLKPGAGVEATGLRDPFAETLLKEHHLCGALDGFWLAVIAVVFDVAGLLVHADYPVDHPVQLGVRVAGQGFFHEPHVDGRQLGIGHDVDNWVRVVFLLRGLLPILGCHHARL